MKGIVRYAVVTHNHTTLSYLLELTSDLVSTEDVAFTATWLLVVRWIDVCPLGNSNCSKVSYIESL